MAWAFDPVNMTAMLASLGACGSAAAAFLSVREMSRQREAGYKPDVMIAPFSIRDEGCELFTQPQVTGRMYNPGMMAARNIEVHFSDNMGSIAGDINTALSDLNTGYSVSANPFKIEERTENGMSGYEIQGDRTLRVSCLFPGKAEGELFRIPSGFTFLASFLCKIAFQKANSSLKDCLRKFVLTSRISFFDMSDRLHTKDQSLHLHDCMYDFKTGSCVMRFM